MIYVSVHICIIQCLERNHAYIYIVYIAHSELVVSIFLGRKEIIRLSRNICESVPVFFPNLTAQQLFSHHCLGSVAVYLSCNGACFYHGGGPVWCSTSCCIHGPGLPVHPSSLPAWGKGKWGRACQEMSELGMVAPHPQGEDSACKSSVATPSIPGEDGQPALGGCVISWHITRCSAPWSNKSKS